MAAYPFNFKKNKNKITLPWMFPWEYSQKMTSYFKEHTSAGIAGKGGVIPPPPLFLGLPLSRNP